MNTGPMTALHPDPHDHDHDDGTAAADVPEVNVGYLILDGKSPILDEPTP